MIVYCSLSTMSMCTLNFLFPLFTATQAFPKHRRICSSQTMEDIGPYRYIYYNNTKTCAHSILQTHTNTYTHTHTHTHTNTSTHTYTHKHTLTTLTSNLKQTHAHICTYAHTYTIFTSFHTHIHTHTQTHAHTLTLTHGHNPISQKNTNEFFKNKSFF